VPSAPAIRPDPCDSRAEPLSRQVTPVRNPSASEVRSLATAWPRPRTDVHNYYSRLSAI
jgi:hypothetical protein